VIYLAMELAVLYTQTDRWQRIDSLATRWLVGEHQESWCNSTNPRVVSRLHNNTRKKCSDELEARVSLPRSKPSGLRSRVLKVDLLPP